MERKLNKSGQPRKISSGPVREKARTMNKMVAAVGIVLQEMGYPGLTIANISNAAGTDRKLVYTYFDTLDNLVETYIKQKDYWNSEAQKDAIKILDGVQKTDSSIIKSLLQGQFDAVINDLEHQKLIHWELGEKNVMLRKISDSREELGERLFQLEEPEFDGSDIDIRATTALLIGGLYYLALHAHSNGSLFCGIDISEPQGKERIDRAVAKVIDMCYEQIKK
ncbi:MAG TPA: TetR/AcrR family transcriptional regulator [Flavobacterium sp.]|nr:TetR/AcrR family transcriptional regulator [Flavobacterium sp.]